MLSSYLLLELFLIDSWRLWYHWLKEVSGILESMAVFGKSMENVRVIHNENVTCKGY